MYAVIVFALVLLSPMPFVSPFGHIVQDVAAQSPFGPFEPATSPSFIIEPNAQEFGIKSDLVHSPAGYFGITKPNFIDTAIIDNDAYVLTTDSTYNVNIRNITNIESPTTVSTIPSYNAYANYLDTVVIDGSTYVVGVGSSDGHFSIADISDTLKTQILFDRPNLKSVLGNATEQVLSTCTHKRVSLCTGRIKMVVFHNEHYLPKQY